MYDYTTEELARQIVRERSHQRVVMRRPKHPRAARVLRKLADRLDTDR